MLQNASQGKTYLPLAALALTFAAALAGFPVGVAAQDAARPKSPPPAATTAALALPFKLPPGTRRLAQESDAAPGVTRHATATGLGEATRFLERQLARAGVACERVGPYRVRGVELTRFVSQLPSTPWLAIHLIRKEGRTFLDVVARPAAPENAPAQSPRENALTIPLTNPASTR